MKKKSNKLVKSVLLAAFLSLFGSKSASAEPIAVNNDMDGTRNEDEIGSMKKSVFKNVLAKVTKGGDIIGINNHRSHSSHRSSSTGHASHYSSTTTTRSTTPSTTTSSSSSTSSSSNRMTTTSNTSSSLYQGAYNTDVNDTAIYTAVLVDPEYPGGENALREFIQSNLQYPQLAKDEHISGKVYVTFVVEKDGSLSNIKVLRDIGGGCGAEVLRLVKLMPNWIPGRQNGKVVRCQYNLPINFSLENDDRY